MTFGSLFAGIGGIDLGLERAGMTCRWQVEIDPWCRRVLAKHWPDVPRYGDIREISVEELERVDLVCGGFPCQPISLAGRRRGQDDERWLWPEFARILRALRPRYALLENVPGLLDMGFGDVLGDVAECGYDAEWECISACAVGAPHPRARLFIVAYPHGQHRDSRRLLAGGATAEDRCREAVVPQRSGWWASEPQVVRVAHGVPGGLDRRRALGNAVVPQVAEYVGRRILAAEGDA